MNILVTYISTMRKDSPETSFATNGLCGEQVIVSRQTNETAVKCLDMMLKEKNETLDRIICILSEKAYADVSAGSDGLSAYNYLKDVRCCKLNSKPEFVEIFDFDSSGALKSEGAIISELCEHIGNNTVYIDTTGGPRNALNLIQLLTKILKYKGINNPCSFYANIQNKNGYIETTDEMTVMTDIADALNEFVHSGKSVQLLKLFEKETNEGIKMLLKDMNDFSESIQLCSLDDLDAILKRLRDSIRTVYQIDSDDMRIVILKNLLTVIENKFFKDDTDSIDYCSIVEWCLENGLVQQAITVYIEKIPSYIFANGIITVSPELYNDLKNRGSSPDAEVFYEKIMDSVLSDRTAYIARLKHEIDIMHFSKTKDKKIAAVLRVLKTIKQETTNDTFRAYINKRKNNCSGIMSIIFSIAPENGWKGYKEMIEAIKNNNSLCARLLGLPKKDSETTFDKKFRTAFKLTKDNLICGAEINDKLTAEEIRRIMLDYIYVKALRNQINHANNEEKLTEAQTTLLIEKGYIMERSIRAVTDNITGSIIRIRKLTNKTKEK